MRTSFLTLLAYVAACSAVVYVPGRYMVELDNLQSLNGHKRSFGSPHEVLYHTLDKRGIEFAVSREFNTAGIFVGASLSLDPEDVRIVAQMPGVVAIRPVINIPGPKPFNSRLATAADKVSADLESTHIMTGVDKAHAMGITGLGIKVGIIDTGIDYTHPLLGGGFGAGHKVFTGFDFVGDAYNGTNTPVPDSDPLDQCNGHGTHVGGILGANPGNDFGISGVAYNATIGAYRLFGCNGSVTDDIISEALIRGFTDGMDILTLSLGGVDGWSEGSSGVVASRISDQGRVVTIAAGNDGALGSWYASSPGTGADVIAVASVDNIVSPMQNATLSGVDHPPISYLSALPLPVNGTFEIFATSTNTSEPADACNPLPDDTPDLSNKVTIVRRGTCDFTTKLANIAAKGGNVSLVYNNVDAFVSIDLGNFTSSLISPEDGAFLVNQFAAGVKVMISFPQVGGAFNRPDPTGGLISTFSSYGPSYDMNFKPSVAAPGGNILSTLPLTMGGFGLDSGTSMATPFTAGSAALLLQARNKKITPAQIRNLLQTTANPISSSHTEGDPLQTLSQQGAGLIQVNIALTTQTIITPGQLTLNDTTHFNGTQKFTIQNTGSKAVTYQLKHVPVGTAVTINPGTITASDGPLNLTTEYATASFPSSVTVQPGKTATVSVKFTAPKVSDPTTYPVYSGFIQVASPTETQRVSYMGVANSLKSKQVIDTTNEAFNFTIPAIVNNAMEPAINASYTLEGDDQPTLLYRLVFGSPLVRVDLVPANTQPPKRKRSGSSWWWPENWSHLASIPTLGALQELDWTPRNGDPTDLADNGWNVYTVNGTYANGSTVADGTYKLLLRALRVTGNANTASDFEQFLSPNFTIKRS